MTTLVGATTTINFAASYFDSLRYSSTTVSGTSNATQFTLLNTSSHDQFTFTGVGFGYAGGGVPNSGTVTGVTHSRDGVVLETISGFSTPVQTLLIAIATGNDTSSMQQLYGGDDHFTGSSADDILTGFAGSDLISGGNGADRLFGDEGLNVQDASTPTGNDTLNGGDGADTLEGNEGDDVMNGDAGDDFVYSVHGSDTIDGGDGADTVRYERQYTGASYTIDLNALTFAESAVGAEPASLTTVINVEHVEIATGSGVDVFTLTAAPSVSLSIDAGGGDDLLVLDMSSSVERVLNTSDSLYLGDYQFLITNDIERFNITGGAVGDSLRGDAGNDVLSGGGGADILRGDAGADIMTGGVGDDLYYVDNAGDVVTEGLDGGIDRINASRSWALSSNIETVVLEGTGNFNVSGNGLGNELRGNSGDNWINGSFGKDILIGGGGRDSFIFNREIKSTNVDTIKDFDTLRDYIRVDDAVFTGLAGPALSADAFYAGAAAHDASDRIIYDARTGSLFFDIDGDGAAVQARFAILQNKPLDLSAADFIII